MNKELRNKRLRKLVKAANKERKKLARQVEILCKDMISAQRELIENVKNMSFSSKFYENLLSSQNMDQLLASAAEQIGEFTENSEISFLLKNDDDYEVYGFHSCMDNEESFPIKKSFNKELFQIICRENKTFDLQQLLDAGLCANLGIVKKYNAVAIPLNHFGQVPGFIFLCRTADNKFKDGEIKKIQEINPGLSKAIFSLNHKKPATA